jgi:plastocyanin
MKRNPSGLLVAVSISCCALFAGIAAHAAGGTAQNGGFSFAQLSDTHWGYSDSTINPDYAGTLRKAIAAINRMSPQPDFVVFTGDLTHTTSDTAERRRRLVEFREITRLLRAQDIRYLPGEHDAALDSGRIYREIFGGTHYTFDHRGVHFIVLDNVSDPSAALGTKQLRWLGKVLKPLAKRSAVIVLTHRPLFDLYPQWGWSTPDGAGALALLQPFQRAAVFYGHIHQLHQDTIAGIVQYAARGMMYPLPAAGSVPKKTPVPWDPGSPYQGLGYRSVAVAPGGAGLTVTEYPITADPPSDTVATARLIEVTAQRFEFMPSVIPVRMGDTVTLSLRSADVPHGFNCPALGLRATITPGKKATVRFIATTSGTFPFFCDIFCGEGHEDMTGNIVIAP